MIRRPPRSTRTDTLCPYTTLFRSKADPMALRIITAEERLSRKPKINVALFGPSGVGKTFQAQTLDPETTLFMDLEAGPLSLQNGRGDVIDVRKEAAALGVHPNGESSCRERRGKHG